MGGKIMKKSTLGFLITVGILVLAIVAVAIAGRVKGKKTTAEIGEVYIPVVVSEVKTGTIEDVISVTGYIGPSEQVNIISKIPGKLLSNVVKEGQEVGVDQVIAYVSRDEVGVEFAPYPVRSTTRGVVAKLSFDPGAMVSPQFPIATVVKIDKVLITTSVVEKDYNRIKLGSPARIYNDAFPDQWFDGKITKIAPTLDQFSHTAEIQIEIPNPKHLLKPGMYVRVELVGGIHEQVPILPKSAITKRLGKDVAFVVNGKIVEMRELKLGYYDLNQYEVVEGVKPGELVVVEDLPLLQDGVKVEIAKNISKETQPTQGGESK
jgi:multidrug efflux pump subunit AcrA (membrane-fusion protein)